MTKSTISLGTSKCIILTSMYLEVVWSQFCNPVKTTFSPGFPFSLMVEACFRHVITMVPNPNESSVSKSQCKG